MVGRGKMSRSADIQGGDTWCLRDFFLLPRCKIIPATALNWSQRGNWQACLQGGMLTVYSWS